jgi:hypothetical protein
VVDEEEGSLGTNLEGCDGGAVHLGWGVRIITGRELFVDYSSKY